MKETRKVRFGTCAHCGEEFEWRKPGGPVARYCSRRCKSRAYARRKTLTCQRCGESFKANSTQTKYCSEACRHPRIGSVCGFCWAPLSGFKATINQYCSPGCNMRHLAQKRRVPKRFTCDWCGVEYKAKASNRSTCCSRECGWALNGATRSRRYAWGRAFTVPGPLRHPRWTECDVCGRGFIAPNGTAKRCSEECAREHARLQYYEIGWYTPAAERNEPVQLLCKECGETFEANTYVAAREFCSKSCSRRHHTRNREDRKRAAFVEPVTIAYLIERDGGACQLCGEKVNRQAAVPHPRAPTRDHIVPVARGGKHSKRNTQLACFQCNSKKGARSRGEQLLLIG